MIIDDYSFRIANHRNPLRSIRPALKKNSVKPFENHPLFDEKRISLIASNPVRVVYRRSITKQHPRDGTKKGSLSNTHNTTQNFHKVKHYGPHQKGGTIEGLL